MSQLKTKFWVDALKWRVEAGGAALYVRKRGDNDAGVVIVQLSLMDGSGHLYVPIRGMDGERMWSQPLGEEPLTESRISSYMERRSEDDPDLWLIEIEDRHGRHFLNEPIEKY